MEKYLVSVVSSEMSATAPLEFLKAHAIAARSWLYAVLDNSVPAAPCIEKRCPGELLRWYGRESHAIFDVCADDHCQRYQGISRLTCENPVRAVEETRGIFLVYHGRVCDARYSKSCGGRTE